MKLLLHLLTSLMAQSRHPDRVSECPLSGVKRTLTNRCSSTSIYEYELRRQFEVSDERIKRLERRTRRLLLSHWADVIRLAARLLDAGSLSRADIAAILKRDKPPTV